MIRSRMLHVLIAAGAPLLAGGCEVLGLSCNDDAPSALVVDVVDDATGAPVSGAIVWVSDGAFTDTLFVEEGTASGPTMRAGNYDVHVEHADYASWVRHDVEVSENACGQPRTRELTARLERNSPMEIRGG